jgi:hypothetical protein
MGAAQVLRCTLCQIIPSVVEVVATRAVVVVAEATAKAEVHRKGLKIRRDYLNLHVRLC